jgi:hypothetical protein
MCTDLVAFGLARLRWLFACIATGMRPFPHDDPGKMPMIKPGHARLAALLLVVIVATWLQGCAGLGSAFGTSTPTPAPPSTPPSGSIAVTVTPASTTVILGNTQVFTATVTNASDTTVVWSVNGVVGGNATTGTISAIGIYTAPVDLPAALAVQVAATSQADTTKSGKSRVIITSDLQIALNTTAAVAELGAAQAFRALITSSGHPNGAIRWALSGAACAPGCGTVDANGNFTAPQILPSPATATLTAQSVADPSKQASAALTISSNFTLQLSAPSSVLVGDSAGIVAAFRPVPGSNPTEVLVWSLSGGGCSGAACGSLDVVTAQSSGGAGGAVADAATYVAPPSAPSPNTVTITATPQADPSKRAQVTLAIQQNGSVSLSPATATIATSHRVTLTAQVIGVANAGVAWSVNNIAGGDATVGQICMVSVNPCQPVTNGTAAQVDYLAPGATPSPNPVTVQATSAADSTKSATSQITVINHVVVTVQPGSVTLAPLAVQGFTATVAGASNQTVVWQVQGTPCAGGVVCGAITPSGTYTAPSAAPSPDSIQVIALSSDDPSQSGMANVTISNGADISALHPASVYAGAAAGFTLRVDGSGFATTNPGPGSSLLIAGGLRTATCSSDTECIVPITAADVAIAGSVAVQIQNPDGTKSNGVSLIVATPNVSDEVISLTNGAPAATAQDIVVVDPTTAGVSLPNDDVDLNLAALGAFSTANNSCTLGGNPLTLQRPVSGTVSADICMFSESGLDASMTFAVSGPGDVIVIAKQPIGLGIVRITLQIPATALPGPRTVFVQNTNLDKAAASGALEVN